MSKFKFILRSELVVFEGLQKFSRTDQGPFEIAIHLNWSMLIIYHRYHQKIFHGAALVGCRKVDRENGSRPSRLQNPDLWILWLSSSLERAWSHNQARLLLARIVIIYCIYQKQHNIRESIRIWKDQTEARRMSCSRPFESPILSSCRRIVVEGIAEGVEAELPAVIMWLLAVLVTSLAVLAVLLASIHQDDLVLTSFM